MFITRHQPLFYLSTGEVGGGEGLAPEGAPETTANTPEGTGNDQQAAQVNWEQRYLDAQAWGTRSAQQLAEAQSKAQLVEAWNSGDPDQQRWAAEQLGIPLEEEPEMEGQFASVDPETQRRLEAFEQWQAQQQQTEQQQQEEQAYRSVIDPLLEQKGIPEGLHDAIREVALKFDPIQVAPSAQFPAGLMPNVDAAVEEFQKFILSGASLPGVQKQIIEGYRSTKQAPHIPSSGQAGTQVPPLGNHANRVKRALELSALDDL